MPAQEGDAARRSIPWRSGDAAVLRAAWAAARAGEPSTVLLRGDAGAGKSRLVRGVAAEAAADGAFVLTGAALDVGDQLPYWPVASALRALLAAGSPDGERARTALAPLAAELPRLVEGAPGPAASPAPEPPDGLLDLVRRVVSALAAAGPVLLAVDDLQWADRATREALVTLVAGTAREPVLLLASVRTEAVGEGHPLRTLLPELARHPRVRVVDLAPLDRPTLARVVREAVGRADHEIEDLVRARSGGNAFIVAETLRAVRDRDPHAVSATLRDLVLGRVAPLDAAARTVVRTVALGEEPVPHRLLAAVVAVPPAALNAALRAARDAGVLVVDPATDGYALRHGLMRDVLAAELLPGERQEVHRRYAEVLDRTVGDGGGDADGDRTPARSGPDPNAVLRRAHHWYLADDPARALPAVLVAARSAEQRRDYAVAHHQWTRVLALTEDRALPVEPVRRALPAATRPDDLHDAVVAHSADVAHLAGEHDTAVHLLRRLLPDAGPGRDVVTVTRLGRYLLDAGRTGDAVAVLGRTAGPGPGAEVDAATDSVPAVPDAAGPADPGPDEAAGPAANRVDASARAALHAARADALLGGGDVRGARDEARRAVELSRAGGERPEQAPMLATLGFALAYLENPEEGLAAVAEGRRIAERTGDAAGIGRAYEQWADLLSGPLNEIAEGVEVARQGVARMRDLGLARTRGVRLLATAANGLFRLGRWREAQDAVDEAWAHRPTGAEALETRLARVRLLVGRGEFAAADEDLRSVELLSSGGGERRRVPLLTLRSGLQMWRGRPAEARALVAAGLDIVARTPDDVFLAAPLVWHGLRAEAEAAALGDRDPDALARLVAHVDDLEARVPTTVPALRRTVGTYVRMCRAEVGRVRGASDPVAWKEVAEAWSALLNPYPAAYAQLRRADALIEHRRGRVPHEATQCLRAAAATAREMGAGPFLAEVAEIAGRAGLAVAVGVDGLAGAGGPGGTPDGGGGAVAVATRVPQRAPELSSLTTREFEVLETLAEGLTNRQISQRLGIKERTVAVHVSNVLRKTGTGSRTQAAALLHRVRAR